MDPLINNLGAVVCPECGGTGDHIFWPDDKCPGCGGTGRLANDPTKTEDDHADTDD